MTSLHQVWGQCTLTFVGFQISAGSRKDLCHTLHVAIYSGLTWPNFPINWCLKITYSASNLCRKYLLIQEIYWFIMIWMHSLQWCHKGHNGVSNQQLHNCFLKPLFRHRSKKTSKPRGTGLCVRGIHQWPVNYPHKERVIWKMFPFDDVIMLIALLTLCGLQGQWWGTLMLSFMSDWKIWWINSWVVCYKGCVTFNIKMSSYQYRDPHVKDKTVSPTVLSLTWESPYPGKTVFILNRGADGYGLWLCRRQMHGTCNVDACMHLRITYK